MPLLISRLESWCIVSENERAVQAETFAEEATLTGVGEVRLAASTVLLRAEADPGSTGGAVGYA